MTACLVYENIIHSPLVFFCGLPCSISPHSWCVPAGAFVLGVVDSAFSSADQAQLLRSSMSADDVGGNVESQNDAVVPLSSSPPSPGDGEVVAAITAEAMSSSILDAAGSSPARSPTPPPPPGETGKSESSGLEPSPAAKKGKGEPSPRRRKNAAAVDVDEQGSDFSEDEEGGGSEGVTPIAHSQTSTSAVAPDSEQSLVPESAVSAAGEDPVALAAVSTRSPTPSASAGEGPSEGAGVGGDTSRGAAEIEQEGAEGNGESSPTAGLPGAEGVVGNAGIVANKPLCESEGWALLLRTRDCLAAMIQATVSSLEVCSRFSPMRSFLCVCACGVPRDRDACARSVAAVLCCCEHPYPSCPVLFQERNLATSSLFVYAVLAISVKLYLNAAFSKLLLSAYSPGCKCGTLRHEARTRCCARGHRIPQPPSYQRAHARRPCAFGV